MLLIEFDDKGSFSFQGKYYLSKVISNLIVKCNTFSVVGSLSLAEVSRYLKMGDPDVQLFVGLKHKNLTNLKTFFLHSPTFLKSNCHAKYQWCNSLSSFLF